MAPIELDSYTSLLPAGVLVSHIFSIGYLSFVAGRTIYHSYLALPPSSGTRHREPLRRGYVQAFSILSFVSLASAAFFAVRFSSLSYQVWALERGIELPESVFGDKGALRGGEHPGRLQIARWLNDTPFYQDALEIVAEKARYFWWGQQVNLGLVSWSMYLAVEGQRRKISNLWAFLALAQLVNLSYAQNLFFVAVLLTPVPLPENVRDITRNSVPITSSRYSQLVEKIIPTKPEGFVPNSALYIILLLSSLTTVFLIPFASNTPSFMTVSIFSRVLPLSFLWLPYLVPTSWGTVHTHPHDAHSFYTALFRTISAISGLLHVKSSAMALFYNTPESIYYRHSLLRPFKEEHRSAFGRGSTAMGRVFGAIVEHPAVTAMGWDVILSGLGLGVWAATRELDSREMLKSSTFLFNGPQKQAENVPPSITVEAERPAKKIEASPSIRRRPGRPKKGDDTPDDSSTVSVPRRRGRPPKKDLVNDDDPDDTAYQPTESDELEEGDEYVEEDWEAGALAWGLITAGGLGTGSAGVFGAEIMARRHR